MAREFGMGFFLGLHFRPGIFFGFYLNPDGFFFFSVESLSETVQKDAAYHAVVHFKPLLADPNNKNCLKYSTR